MILDIFLGIIGYLSLPILLITFSDYILIKNSLKDPRIMNSEKDNITKTLKRKECIIYKLSIMLAIIFCLIFNTKVELIKVPMVFLSKVIVATLTILLIVTKINKKQALSNILHLTLIIPIIILFFIIIPYILIFSDSNHSCGGSQLQDFEITSFNSKFTQYEGVKTGAQVKALIQEWIIPSNSNPENEDRLVSVEFLDEKGNPWTEISIDNNTIVGDTSIKRNSKYKVEFKYNNEGYIYECMISQVISNKDEL